MCQPQKAVLRDLQGLRITSRDRIAKLERQVDHLYRLLSARNGTTPAAEASTQLDDPTETLDRAPTADVQSESDSEADDPTPQPPPAYLQQLLRTSGYDKSEDEETFLTGPSRHLTSLGRYERARKLLRAHIPSRAQAAAIAAYADQWLHITGTLFPVPDGMRNVEELLVLWDKVQDPAANPAEMAVLLVSLSVTVLQTSPGQAIGELQDEKQRAAFVRTVSDAVEAAIIQDDVIASSLDGLQVCLIWTRMQLVHSRLQKTWINLRRLIALAEFVGLPKAAQKAGRSFFDTATSNSGEEQHPKFMEAARLWTAICATDRFACMVFSLPLGTAHHPFVSPEPVNAGVVDQRAYLVRLADIAGELQSLDRLQTQGESWTELCSRVLQIDGRLRQLANSTPPGWWQLASNSLTPEHFLQHFHQYLLVRTHLQLALQNQRSNAYLYSDMVCTEACTELGRRYVSFRSLLPAGFFAARALDLQVLPAALFTLNKVSQLRGDPSGKGSSQIPAMMAIINGIIGVLDGQSDRPGPGGLFARQAARAISIMRDFLDGKNVSPDGSLSVSLPLVGHVKVRRREPANPACTTQPTGTSLIPEAPFDGAVNIAQNLMDDLPRSNGILFDTLSQEIPMGEDWSMEISDIFPFLPGQANAMDPWLSPGASMPMINF